MPGGRTGCQDARRGARRGACRRGEQRRRAVGPRMLRRAADHRRLGARRGRRRRADAARAGASRSPATARDSSPVRRSSSRPAARRRSTSSRASLPMQLSKPVLTILRSGCYVTHDSGFYERMPGRREGAQRRAVAGAPGLQPALEVWSRVQSCPEPGLAILTHGQARRVVRPRDADRRQALPPGTRRGRRSPCRQSWKIAAHERSARLSALRRRRRRAAGRRSRSAAASRIRARRSTSGARCSPSTTTIA